MKLPEPVNRIRFGSGWQCGLCGQHFQVTGPWVTGAAIFDPNFPHPEDAEIERQKREHLDGCKGGPEPDLPASG